MRFYFQDPFFRSQQISGHSGDLSWASSRASQLLLGGGAWLVPGGHCALPCDRQDDAWGSRMRGDWGLTRHWQGWGSPNTCFSPRGEGAFAGAAVAGAGQAPGSSCRGFPGSGLTWAGTMRPLPRPAGCKTQPYATAPAHAVAGLPRHPAARLHALLGWEQARGWPGCPTGLLTARLLAGPSPAPPEMQPEPLTCGSHPCSEFCLLSAQKSFPGPCCSGGRVSGSASIGWGLRALQRCCAWALGPSLQPSAGLCHHRHHQRVSSVTWGPVRMRALAGMAQNVRNVLW